MGVSLAKLIIYNIVLLFICHNKRSSSSSSSSSSSGHSEDPAKHPHLRGSNLSLVGDLQCQSRSDNGLVYLCFEPEGNLPVIQYPGQFSPTFTL